ncbi:hypothetical protein [Mycobacterium sp.]|uniref:hypothetical protein n=1 Tax=Mycobacterium sp. TaxID=1785 RepID=UPI003D14D70A
MTTDGRTEDTAPDSELGKAKSEAPAPSAHLTETNLAQSKPDANSKKKKKVERPETVAALFQYAYREAVAGRQLNLSRDLTYLVADPDSLQQEKDLVRTLAAEDPLLAVPPNLLADIADLQIAPHTRERILELLLVALAVHKVFEGSIAQLVDPRVEPTLTAREISSVARIFTSDIVSQEQRLERRAAKREQIRVNAVTAFELFRVLRDGWTIERFIEDMSAFVWDGPSLRAPSAAALLATAKTEPLSQLARHFRSRLLQQQQATEGAHERAAAQVRRAEMAEERTRSMNAALESEKSRSRELQSQAAELRQLLETEQSRRFVESTHAAHDYEILRAQVIRQLAPQINLLTDGLHALRNGSPDVAEEFVDRALTKIDSEVKRLTELEGETQ